MNTQRDERRQAAKQETQKPKYIKPEVIAIYSEQELEKEFGEVYGLTFVDLFS